MDGCSANMATYQAPYVRSTYNVSKHMGFYYELGFRDLYPGPPLCDCQHTTKVLDEGVNYHEQFNFQCFRPGGGDHSASITNLITLNASTAPRLQGTGVFAQTITETMGMKVGTLTTLLIPGMQLTWLRSTVCLRFLE
jgi:hypothetical protein